VYACHDEDVVLCYSLVGYMMIVGLAVVTLAIAANTPSAADVGG